MVLQALALWPLSAPSLLSQRELDIEWSTLSVTQTCHCYFLLLLKISKTSLSTLAGTDYTKGPSSNAPSPAVTSPLSSPLLLQQLRSGGPAVSSFSQFRSACSSRKARYPHERQEAGPRQSCVQDTEPGPRQVWGLVPAAQGGRKQGRGLAIQSPKVIVCKLGQLPWTSLHPRTTVRTSKRLLL